MVTLARTTTGLLYQSDGSLTGWSNGGDWASAADPAFCCFDPLPLALLGPSAPGAGSEYAGCREFQLYIESLIWYLLHDAGDNIGGWLQQLAVSYDRGLTWTRLGPFSEGYAEIGGGTYAATSTGWLEKRGSTYIRHRLAATGVYSSPNNGLPGGSYGWDIWTASSLTGTWTGVLAVSPASGTWMDQQINAGSVIYDGSSTYYAFVGAMTSTSPDETIGQLTASAATGPWTRVDPAIVTISNAPGGRYCENPRAFYHPGLSVYCILANASLNAQYTDSTVTVLSSSLSVWSSPVFRLAMRAAPLNTGNVAVGVMSHVTGPNGALIYDSASGIVPVTYDSDPQRWSPGYHLGRRCRTAALEPSASCLRYAGSADTTARSLSRSLACTNVVVELAIEPTAVNGGGGSLSVDLTNGSGNGYRFSLAEGGQVSILKLTAGTPTTLTAGSGTQVWDIAQLPHPLKVSIQSGTLTARLDGEVQATATDSTTTTFTTLALTGAGVNCDVRCLSARTGDTVTVAGLTPGSSANVRGYGGMPAGSVAANASGTGTYSQSHYPLWSLDLGGTDYTPATGIWGGDTLTFTGLAAGGSGSGPGGGA